MIPRILHQTWKDARIPERFQPWQASWQRLNPGFEFRLWTDEGIGRFIEARYPEWSSVMQGYRAPISRVDLARYLILHQYGGVYADLDEECLKPFDPLLEGRTFIIGTEPVTHERDAKAVQRGLKNLLCPTVIASAPGHPFWEHLFEHLRAAAHEPDALDATGPFLLTRAHASYRGPPISVVAPEVFYPLDKAQCRDERFRDRSAWPAASREAYAIHHWEGTWWRPEHRGKTVKAGKAVAAQPSGTARPAMTTHAAVTAGTAATVTADLPRETAASRVRVALYGHLSGVSGLASAARGTGAALGAAGIPFTGFDIPDGAGPRIAFDPGLPEEEARQRSPGATAIDLVHTNPDALLTALSGRDPSATRAVGSGRFRVGYWAWEGLAGIPAHWHRAFELFDEIWVPSQFTARAVAHHVPVPVLAMGHPVEALPTGLSRRDLRLPERGFCFLAMVDALSNLARKNPTGVIRAYCAAFPEPSAEVFLVLKIRNLDARNLEVLRRSIGSRGDILLLNGTLSQIALGSLMAACDAYVSLHRAEGFGLTIAEAMAAGKPVIATDYSANTEFMTSGTGYPVPFRLVELEKDDGYYRKGTRWADPDLAEAARLMRRLVANRDEGRETGARAAAQIRQALSPAAIGLRMRERLELLDRHGKLSKQDSRRQEPVAPDRPAMPAAGITMPAGTATRTPHVLVLTPMKNTAAHLDRYARLLEALDYPREALSLAILEGDSTDDTWSRLLEMQDRLENRFSRVRLHRHDEGCE